MGILRAPLLLNEPSGQVIKGSLRFQNELSTYLSRTPSSAGDRDNYTGSVWVKRTKFAPENNSNSNTFNYTIFTAGTNSANNSDQIKFYKNAGTDDANKIEYSSYVGSYQYLIYTNAKYRDPGGWYNVVWNYDGTTAKVYVNGEQITSFDTNTQNGGSSGHFNNNVAHVIGHTCDQNNSSQFDGYMSQFYWIDGQTLDASYFGFTDPLTNTWRPKKYTGTFGSNGFYLPMDNQDDFEKDKSGNGNDFTKNNFSGTSIDPDVVKDSPSGAVFGGRGQTGITTTSSAPANYATLNPLSNVHGTFSEGNLEAQSDTSGQYSLIPSTLLINKTGKFYWEVKFNTGSTDDAKYATIGICSESRRMITNQGLAAANNVGDYAIKGWDGGFYTMTNQSITYNNGSNQSNTLNNNDVVSVAFNADNGKLWFGVNGTYLTNAAGVGNPSLDLNPDLTAPTDIGHYPAFGAYNSDGQSSELHVNFGQKPFKYAPPQGFLPLNSATARPNTVVPRPEQYVGVVTYTGNATTGRAITGLNFDDKPDLIWIKNRGEAVDHTLYDSVRGFGANKELTPNGTYSEGQTGVGNPNSNAWGYVNSIIRNGFVINNGSSGQSLVNNNNIGYVAWCWKAGGNKNTFNVDGVGYATTTAAGLTAGDTAPTGASVGTKQGFSIIKYTGPNDTSNHEVPHGLSQAPDFIIAKNLDITYNWDIYHSSLADDAYLIFTNAATRATGFSGRPTSTVFKTEHDYSTNENEDYIAYLWHNVPGLQKFGKYVGNGSADGPFVELGFRPAVLIWKKSSASGGHWNIEDNGRSPFNPVTISLRASTTEADLTTSQGNIVELLSNGFKVRNTSDQHNSSGVSYIYAAWAAAPASNLFGGQSNAR